MRLEKESRWNWGLRGRYTQSGVSSPFILFLHFMVIITKYSALFIFIHLKIGIIGVASLSFLLRFVWPPSILLSTQIHPTTSYFVIALYVFDECPTSYVVFAGGNARCCPFNPIICLYKLLKALKFKVWLPSLLMPFHFRFLLFHSLFVLVYLSIVTFSSFFFLDEAPFH